MTNDVPMDPEAGPLNLAQMMVQMMNQMNDMRAEQASEREAMRVQIRALQENVASLQTTPVATPQTPTPPALPGVSVMPPAPPGVTVTPPSPPGQTKKKATLPDPPRFDGTRKKFRTWKQEMESKLETDGPAIGTRRDQFAYIFARLTDVPQAMSAAYYDHSKQTGATDPSRFLSYLSSCYLDPNLS